VPLCGGGGGRGKRITFVFPACTFFLRDKYGCFVVCTKFLKMYNLVQVIGLTVLYLLLRFSSANHIHSGSNSTILKLIQLGMCQVLKFSEKSDFFHGLEAFSVRSHGSEKKLGIL
jgi:hypothetical protein